MVTAEPHSDIAVPVTQEFDAQICAQPVYVMWPVPDSVRQPLEEPMPETIRARLGEKVAEFHQPPLSSWRETILKRSRTGRREVWLPGRCHFSLEETATLSRIIVRGSVFSTSVTLRSAAVEATDTFVSEVDARRAVPCPVCSGIETELYIDGDDNEISVESVGSSRTLLSHGRVLRCILWFGLPIVPSEQ